ncbi:putative 2-oxoglutarate-dependent dioxygenase AOP1.2 isoform X3 [Nicotiana tabacum]|uniref:2-oxoglutarate-dependent dioxygenase AOP1.2 isoform X3 n=1 Tax=Nicotiana tabacum TaxID=4097 RepID=A0AC58RQQ0_TOBAC
MGSETIKLPNIDFSNEDLKPGSLVWNQVKNQVHKALVNYGCFEASFDKIPIHLRKSIFESLKELFDLPLQTKIRNISTKPFHGYVGQYPAVPLYESMGIDDANISDKAERFTRILWPEGNPNFCKTIQSYSEQLSELDQTVRKMILESLGVEKYMDEHMNSTNYLLRVMKYKGPQSNDTKLGLNAHTDKNIVTILYQNQVNGLEVLTKDGQWINVEPTPDAFIVMIGDSLYCLCFSEPRVYLKQSLSPRSRGKVCLHTTFLGPHYVRLYWVYCCYYYCNQSRHGQMVEFIHHIIG